MEVETVKTDGDVDKIEKGAWLKEKNVLREI